MSKSNKVVDSYKIKDGLGTSEIKNATFVITGGHTLVGAPIKQGEFDYEKFCYAIESLCNEIQEVYNCRADFKVSYYMSINRMELTFYANGKNVAYIYFNVIINSYDLGSELNSALLNDVKF